MKTFSLKLLKESIIVAISTLLGTFTGIGIAKMLTGDASLWCLIIPVIMTLVNILMNIFTEIRIRIKDRKEKT